MTAQEELENYLDEQYIPLRLPQEITDKFLKLLSATIQEAYQNGYEDGKASVDDDYDMWTDSDW